MPREERKKSSTGIYHIMFRGINKQDIFYDQEDRKRFIEMLRKYKEMSGYKIYGYCLMSNHIHLLVKEGKETVSQSMKRLGVSYAYWYNTKYERYGHLFQDRYKSETVENEGYLLVALRYIHRNPIKAGIVRGLEEYTWSSYNDFISLGSRLSDIDFILDLFNSDRAKSIENYKVFMAEGHEDKCLDYKEEKKRIQMSDEDLKEILRGLLKTDNPQVFQQMKKEDRDKVIKRLKAQQVSIRQLARLTGLGRNIIQKG